MVDQQYIIQIRIEIEIKGFFKITIHPFKLAQCITFCLL
jgi:hypothetical protein